MPNRSTRLVAFERHRRIAELLRDRGTVRASELIRLFGVTDETIRRDLSQLADLGLLHRAHSGAVAAPIRSDDDRPLRARSPRSAISWSSSTR